MLFKAGRQNLLSAINPVEKEMDRGKMGQSFYSVKVLMKKTFRAGEHLK